MPFEPSESMTPRQVFETPEALKAALQQRVIEVDGGCILEIGPYIRPQRYVHGSVFLFIEPHLPYIEIIRGMIRERYGSTPFPAIFLQTTAAVALPMFPDRSVDTVFAGDVIEHMRKEEGHDLLEQAKRVARRQVIIFTPLGYMPQVHVDGRLDKWGVEETHWEDHLCGWLPEEFGEEWEVLLCEQYHVNGYDGQDFTEPYGAFFAVHNVHP